MAKANIFALNLISSPDSWPPNVVSEELADRHLEEYQQGDL